MQFGEIPGASLCQFEKGERIIKAGRKVSCCYYLLSGSAQVEFVTKSGKENVIAVKTGDQGIHSLLGLLSLYNRTTDSTAYYDIIANTSCVCFRIPAEECKRFMRQNPAMLEAALYESMETYMLLWKNFYCRQEDSGAGGRLCELLLAKSVSTPDGPLIPPEYTNIQLAKLTAVHKVTISRMLRTLMEEDAIKRTPKGLLIKKPDLLKQYSMNEKKLIYK